MLHEEIPSDEGLCHSWNQLVQQVERPEIFYTYEWALAAYRAFGETVTPLLFLAYEGDTLVGVVALTTDAGAGNISFLSSITADYCDFISAPEFRPQFVEAVLAALRKRNCRTLIFASVPADSATARALTAVTKRDYFTFLRPGYLCAQVAIDTTERRKYAQQSSRRRLHRFQKASERDPSVTIKNITSSDEIGDAFNDFAKAHVARFLSNGQISNLALAARRNFLIQVSRLFSSGSVVLSRLMFAGRAVAWNFGFQYGGSWFWYQPTFDTGFYKKSPGVWLLTAIVEQACESSKIDRVDLGLGAEGYKERLANSSRQTLHITMSRSLLKHLAAMCRYKVACRLKSAPVLDSLIRQAKKRFTSLRSLFRDERVIKSLSTSAQYIRRALSGRPILFYEWEEIKLSRDANRIVPIDLNLLAEAAMHYEGDSDTLNYLLYAANLTTAKLSGFALIDENGIPGSFFWTRHVDVTGIPHSEDPPNTSGSESTLIWNYWIPVSMRAGSYAARALSFLAAHLRASETQPWITIPSYDGVRAKEVTDAGFVYRFSTSGRHPWARSVTGSTAPLDRSQAEPIISSAA